MYKIFSLLIRLILSEAMDFHASCRTHLTSDAPTHCSSIHVKISMTTRKIGKRRNLCRYLQAQYTDGKKKDIFKIKAYTFLVTLCTSS